VIAENAIPQQHQVLGIPGFGVEAAATVVEVCLIASVKVRVLGCPRMIETVGAVICGEAAPEGRQSGGVVGHQPICAYSSPFHGGWCDLLFHPTWPRPPPRCDGRGTPNQCTVDVRL